MRSSCADADCTPDAHNASQAREQVAGAQVAGEVAGGGSKSPAAAKKTPEAKSTPATGAASSAAKPAGAKAAAPAAAAAKVAELKAKAMALKAKAVKLVAGWKPLDWALFALCVLTALGARLFALRGVPTFTLFKPPPKVGFLSGKAFDLQSKTLAKKAPGSALVAFTCAAAPPRRRRTRARAQFALRAQATPRRATRPVCAHRSPLTATPAPRSNKWCDHCRDLAQPLQDAQAALKGTVKFAQLDCDKYFEVCEAFGVEGAEGAGTPWIGWFKDGLLQAGYDGERTKAGFVAWAKAHKEEL